MPVDQVKVDIQSLTTGMYVSRLDRPWIETPFPLQGYYIKELQDINALKQYCDYVYIDIRRGKSPVDNNMLQTLDMGVDIPVRKPVNPDTKFIAAKKLIKREGIYVRSTAPKQEVKKAIKMKKLATLAISYIDVALQRNEQLPIQETKKVVSTMVQDILRNPDAFIWLNKIKDKDSNLYGHTIRTTIWAVSMGRHMGLATDALNNLALGIMISDVGKTHLPSTLLKKDKLDFTDQELAIYQSHVCKALEIIKRSNNVDKQVLSIVANMHERHNGSGYPRGLTGDQIPYLAKIAGISSAYDELTFPHNTEFGLSPSDAIASLFEKINILFQQDLVEEFIRAIGIYPAGSLVELSTGETAMVLEQNPERRLRPIVILLMNEERQLYKKYKILDLSKHDTRMGMQLDIRYSLPIGSYGADPQAIYESAFVSRWRLSLAS